jgi:hypothetical protein
MIINVSIDGNNSVLFDLLLGMALGLILGTVLYAIFDITDISAFVEDTKSQDLLSTRERQRPVYSTNMIVHQ